MEAIEPAETYHRTGEWDYACGTALLRSLAIAPGVRVLELGSATGRLAIDAAHLVAPGGEVIALEPSEGRVELARRIYRAGNVTFHLGGPKELANFGEASVDMVYSNLLLHRLDDPGQALGAVFRALKPGGSFAFTCPVAPPELIKTLEMVIFSHPAFASHRQGSSGLVTWFCQPSEDWIAIVKEAGFDGVSFQLIVAELAFDSPSALVAYWEGATDGRFLRGLTGSERESVMAHVDEKFSVVWGAKPLRDPVEVVAFQTTRPL